MPSKLAISLAAQMLGEREMPVDPEPETELPPEPNAAPDIEGAGGEESEYTNPDIESLVNLWQSGNYSAVALRVLDSLDQYRDFVELLYRIGHEDALKLGEIMDELTADQKSPHRFDQVADDDVPERFPVPSGEPEAEPETHRESEPPDFNEIARAVHEDRHYRESEGTADDDSGGDKDAEEDQEWNPNRGKKWSKMLAKMKARRGEK